MLRFGQMFHQPQQAQPRRRHRAAQRFTFKPFQLAKQGGAVEVELLCQRVALVSQTIGRGPLYGRLNGMRRQYDRCPTTGRLSWVC